MPDLKVMTWNSTGESAAKAVFLHALIVNNPNIPGWMPDVIVLQEAQAAPGGPIWAMLVALGTPGTPQYSPNYAGVAPQFVGIPGEGYILMTSAAVGSGPFAAVNLAADPGVVAAANAFAAGQGAALLAAAAANRAPAHARLTFAGRAVEFMTWHAPLGPGLPFMLGVRAAVDYSAYFLLQVSQFYTTVLCLPGGGNTNLGLIAADLNVTASDLSGPTGVPAVPHLLPNWTALSHHLDHIAARRDAGAGGISFSNHGSYPTGTAHDVLVSTVHWP